MCRTHLFCPLFPAPPPARCTLERHCWRVGLGRYLRKADAEAGRKLRVRVGARPFVVRMNTWGGRLTYTWRRSYANRPRTLNRLRCSGSWFWFRLWFIVEPCENLNQAGSWFWFRFWFLVEPSKNQSQPGWAVVCSFPGLGGRPGWFRTLTCQCRLVRFFISGYWFWFWFKFSVAGSWFDAAARLCPDYA